MNVNTGFDSRPVEIRFPVSSGKHHQDEDLEPETEVNEIVFLNRK